MNVNLFTRLALALSILVSGSLMMGDTIYSSTCSINGMPAITGTNSCIATSGGTERYFDTYAIATTSIGVNFATNPADLSTIVSSEQTQLSAALILSLQYADASATASFSQQLTTSGPARMGLLQIYAECYGCGDVYGGIPASASTAIDFGMPLPSANGPLQCGLHGGCENIANLLYHYDSQGGFPVQLGTPFTLSVNDYIQGFATNQAISDGNGQTSFNVTFSFKFVELDGTTPVAVEVTPEPSSYALVGSGLIACAVLRRRARVRHVAGRNITERIAP